MIDYIIDEPHGIFWTLKDMMYSVFQKFILIVNCFFVQSI